MIPNWKIGLVARRRLDEMARDGFDRPRIWFPQNSKWTAYVSIHNVFSDVCFGAGNTIGQAVGEAYRAWKKHRETA